MTRAEMEEKLRKNREEILRIAKRHGAHSVRLFGSLRRGEADEIGDIDLLVELEDGVTLLQHAAMVRELEELMGCQVDVVSERGLRSRIRDRILEEAIPI